MFINNIICIALRSQCKHCKRIMTNEVFNHISHLLGVFRLAVGETDGSDPVVVDVAGCRDDKIVPLAGVDDKRSHNPRVESVAVGRYHGKGVVVDGNLDSEDDTSI